MLKGKILITGGSGFLGRGIMRAARARNWDCEFTVYSRDEYKQDVCKRKYPAKYVLGSIGDIERMVKAMRGMDYVIHAAALKFIPEGELNVDECVSINVDGSRNVIQAARRAGVGRVIGISTDKAVHPVNVYGMTKAIMERMFGEASDDSTIFTACRYGNVIGSTGSVIPAFKRQLAERDCVQVTDPEMTRFWLDIDSAVDLVVGAAGLAAGCVLIPAPTALGMYDIALAIAGGPDRIEILGPRPGEKTHEDMITEYEANRLKLWPPPSWKVPWGRWYALYPPPNRFLEQEGLKLSSKNAEPLVVDKFLRYVEESLCV